MKATELMCGDLILVDGRPTRVYGIMERMGRVYDTMTNDISLKRCKPIPITTELLKKNHFRDIGGHLYDDDGEFYELSIYQYTDSIWQATYHTTEFCIGDERKFVCYLHELQQFIRACGIEKEFVI